MRRLLLPLVGLCALVSVGGCSQIIADKVLVPPRNLTREAGLMKARHRIEARWDNKLRPFIYKSFDGAQMAGMLFEPRVPKAESAGKPTTRPAAGDDAPVKPKGVIVVIHGLTDRKESMLSVAESYAEAGYVAVCPDLRAHGESGGKYTSLGYYEKRDMMALLNHLQQQGYDVSRVGAFGGSLGAAISIQWAAMDPRVKSIIAVAPFADLRSELTHAYAKFNIGGLIAAVIEDAAQREGRFKIGDVSPLQSLAAMDTPLYLAHGFKDTLIPDSHSQMLFDRARGPVVFQRAIAGHIDIRDALGRPFMKRSIEWMNAYVPADAPALKYPLWVANYGSRNFPMTAPVAVSDQADGAAPTP
ncbi:MAG TPA: alpha/beta fold hydrolase [Tepidisphaeraceae bacterium]|nr:alpha/beta fold hydrolase [Tepidisphaeraceae bacterium]